MVERITAPSAATARSTQTAPSRRRRLRVARAAAPAVIAAAAAICAALNWPGHFSYDSVVQLAEGRTGVYAGGHPPVMSWLLGLAAAAPGPAAFVLFDVALVWGSLLAFALAAGGAAWRAAILVALLAAAPQLLIYPAIAWKDVLFAGSMCAGFACLATAAAGRSRPRWRWPWLSGALVLLSLAALARQNGAVALPMAAGAVGWIAAKGGASARRSFAHGAGFLGAAAALVGAANVGLNTHLEGPSLVADQLESLEVYDIVGILKRDPKISLPQLHAGAPALESALRGPGVAAYSLARVDPIEPILDNADPDRQDRNLMAAQWRDLILAHPALYARVRASDFAWVFLTPDPDSCPLVETGVEGPAEEMVEARLSPRKTALDDTLGDYALTFEGTPVFSHAAYAVAALAMIVLLLRRRAAADIAVAAMLASALLFAGSFAIISISCDYRYLYALDLAAIAGAVYVAAGPRWRRGKAAG